ncbi:MAG: TIGR04282 family arsenosugar biosynthesis glycosyltransferase [Planctomycetota bacterium]
MDSKKIVTNENIHLSVVVMAKAAVPSRVKTRLTRGYALGPEDPDVSPTDHTPLSPEQAAKVHAAMFETVLQRLADQVTGPAGEPPILVLAMDDPTATPKNASEAGWDVVEQGQGDLGERLERVWRICRERHGTEAVVFFGVDSPDVPADVLRQVGPTLNNARAALGPVEDGGYWTLACRTFQPGLLRGIDWGTPAVYDQTVHAAEALGLTLTVLPAWHDVDEPDDLAALQRRLKQLDEPREPALIALADRLDQLLNPPTPETTRP